MNINQYTKNKNNEVEVINDKNFMPKINKNDVRSSKISEGKFIRFSRECLSGFCKLGVTYEHLSVDLLNEIMNVGTDLINMYVHSEEKNNEIENLNEKDKKTEKEAETETEIENGNNQNGNLVDIKSQISLKKNNLQTNSGSGSRSSTKLNLEINTIPLVTLAAASLHWIASMKIPYSVLQNEHKKIILMYLNKILILSMINNKSFLSFSFLLSILTNLEILNIKYNDFNPKIKRNLHLFCCYINNKSNINKLKKNEIENQTKNKKIGIETETGNLDEKCIFQANIIRFENLLKKMNSPTFLELIEKSENYEIDENEIEITKFVSPENYLSKMDNNKKEDKKQIIKNNIKEKDKENENKIAVSKLLLKLSSKIINLKENDLLRVIFQLGQRKIPISDLRQAHIPNVGQLRIQSDAGKSDLDRGTAEMKRRVFGTEDEVQNKKEVVVTINEINIHNNDNSNNNSNNNNDMSMNINNNSNNNTNNINDDDNDNNSSSNNNDINDMISNNNDEIKQKVEVEVEVEDNRLSLLQVVDVQLYGIITNLSPGMSFFFFSLFYFTLLYFT